VTGRRLGSVTDQGTPEALVRAAAAQGVRDPRLLEALRVVPRAAFVPPEHAGRAYIDAPVPIAHGQVTTQPSLVAAMIDSLRLEETRRVLEVGTGLGWQTALLARLAREVVSVERWPDLARDAAGNLHRAGIENAEVVVGDGSRGWPERAPYDAVLVSAAFPRVPGPLSDQLVETGLLVMPMGRGGAEEVVLFGRRAGDLRPVRRITAASFVRLYGSHGFPEDDPA
jgi:protein-L-isoaspartate(D-aspartate) O-methyltransferase